MQLAVQGKLGTQDAGDEPASKLASKIFEEKNRLIKEGTISKSRGFPEIESEEIPFQVPPNWIWLRLDVVGHNCGQKVPDKIFTYIDVTAINKEKGLIGDEVNVLQPNEAPSRARKIVKKGTVIYSTVRPYLLNIAIVDKEINPEPIVSTAFAVVHPFEGIFNRYLFYYLRSKPFIKYVESQMTGMAYPAINDQKFHMGLIPVPPTAEQHRIVAKVDRLMALCDELEARQQQERAGCLKLGTATLAGLQNATHPEEFERLWAQVCDAFDLILDCPENVAGLRQTILLLAVQGKLGTQDVGDEPASDLIGKIQKEKSALIEKRKLRENKITELKEIQEMKYEIPPRWTWERMGDVVFFQEGPGIRNWQFRTSGIKLLNVSNILSDGGLNFNSSDKYVSEEEVKEKYSQFLIEDKDLLLASSGGSWGKVAWFKDPGYPIILNTSTVRLRFYSEQFAERYLQCLIV
ncbi:MAG: restriction endonuclease subunit S [Methanoregula sp.]|nr:restriction endonuclease subunit S [Methanoregula sp.]